MKRRSFFGRLGTLVAGIAGLPLIPNAVPAPVITNLGSGYTEKPTIQFYCRERVGVTIANVKGVARVSFE